MPKVAVSMPINVNTLSMRPSGSRPAQRDSWYSRAQGMSAHQPLRPDFSNIFHRPAMYSTPVMT